MNGRAYPRRKSLIGWAKIQAALHCIIPFRKKCTVGTIEQAGRGASRWLSWILPKTGNGGLRLGNMFSMLVEFSRMIES